MRTGRLAPERLGKLGAPLWLTKACELWLGENCVFATSLRCWLYKDWMTVDPHPVYTPVSNAGTRRKHLNFACTQLTTRSSPTQLSVINICLFISEYTTNLSTTGIWCLFRRHYYQTMGVWMKFTFGARASWVPHGFWRFLDLTIALRSGYKVICVWGGKAEKQVHQHSFNVENSSELDLKKQSQISHGCCAMATSAEGQCLLQGGVPLHCGWCHVDSKQRPENARCNITYTFIS